MDATLFDFNDYREYLTKVMMPNGPYQQKGSNLSRWSRRLGHSSPSLLSMVLKGDRTPSDELLEKLVDELKLSRPEANFLRLKVKLERLERKGKSSEEIRQEIDSLIKSVGKVRRQVVGLSAFESIAQWYCVVIKQLIALGDFVEDADWVCRRLRQKVRPHQVKKAIEHLLALGTIQRNEVTGRLEVVHAVSTPSEIPSPAIVQHHLGMIDRARDAIEEQKVQDRCFMDLTLRADAKDLPEIKKEIAEFIEMMNDKYAVEDAARVYQLNVQYFEHTTETSSGERLQ
ncbi:MAG: TIGR02147 family protein [Bacteriovoracaceae bacterium]|nr:TIGR02147 family protein [Bacteriovoracaceae bacterium]